MSSGWYATPRRAGYLRAMAWVYTAGFAFVVFITFEAALATGADAATLVNLIGAVFIAPFMLFSATAGQLADKYEKSGVIRYDSMMQRGVNGGAAVVAGPPMKPFHIAN